MNIFTHATRATVCVLALLLFSGCAARTGPVTTPAGQDPWPGVYICRGTAPDGQAYQLQLSIIVPEPHARVSAWAWTDLQGRPVAFGAGLRLTPDTMTVGLRMPTAFGVGAYRRVDKAIEGEYTGYGSTGVFSERCVPGRLVPASAA